MGIQPFPVIESHQVVLLRNDLYTGIIKDVQLETAIGESEEVYSIYESLTEAIKAGESIVERYDFIECFILDKNKQIVKHLQPS